MSQDQENPRIQIFEDWYNQGSENRNAEILQERWKNIDCTRPKYEFFNWLYHDKNKWNIFIEALPGEVIYINIDLLKNENFNTIPIESSHNRNEILPNQVIDPMEVE